MRKIIFLDLDGTLINDNNVISKKTHQAITHAREKGNKVFICTGRSENEVFENILSIGFDGMIYSNGAHIIAENKTIFHSNFQLEMITELDSFMKKNQIAYSIQNSKGLFASKEYIFRFEQLVSKQIANIHTSNELVSFTEHSQKVREAIAYSENLIQLDINNISFIALNQESVDKLFDTFQKKFEMYQNVVPVFGPYSGEIGLKGITKGVAIQNVADYFIVDIKDTIGIGDGVNDIPMLEKVGIGVAMGNASEFVQEKANMVTRSIDEDGIFYAFKTLNLI